MKTLFCSPRIPVPGGQDEVSGLGRCCLGLLGQAVEPNGEAAEAEGLAIAGKQVVSLSTGARDAAGTAKIPRGTG